MAMPEVSDRHNEGIPLKPQTGKLFCFKRTCGCFRGSPNFVTRQLSYLAPRLNRSLISSKYSNDSRDEDDHDDDDDILSSENSTMPTPATSEKPHTWNDDVVLTAVDIHEHTCLLPIDSHQEQKPNEDECVSNLLLPTSTTSPQVDDICTSDTLWSPKTSPPSTYHKALFPAQLEQRSNTTKPLFDRAEGERHQSIFHLNGRRCTGVEMSSQHSLLFLSNLFRKMQLKKKTAASATKPINTSRHSNSVSSLLSHQLQNNVMLCDDNNKNQQSIKKTKSDSNNISIQQTYSSNGQEEQQNLTQDIYPSPSNKLISSVSSLHNTNNNVLEIDRTAPTISLKDNDDGTKTPSPSPLNEYHNNKLKEEFFLCNDKTLLQTEFLLNNHNLVHNEEVPYVSTTNNAPFNKERHPTTSSSHYTCNDRDINYTNIIIPHKNNYQNIPSSENTALEEDVSLSSYFPTYTNSCISMDSSFLEELINDVELDPYQITEAVLMAQQQQQRELTNNYSNSIYIEQQQQQINHKNNDSTEKTMFLSSADIHQHHSTTNGIFPYSKNNHTIEQALLENNKTLIPSNDSISNDSNETKLISKSITTNDGHIEMIVSLPQSPLDELDLEPNFTRIMKDDDLIINTDTWNSILLLSQEDDKQQQFNPLIKENESSFKCEDDNEEDDDEAITQNVTGSLSSPPRLLSKALTVPVIDKQTYEEPAKALLSSHETSNITTTNNDDQITDIPQLCSIPNTTTTPTIVTTHHKKNSNKSVQHSHSSIVSQKLYENISAPPVHPSEKKTLKHLLLPSSFNKKTLAPSLRLSFRRGATPSLLKERSSIVKSTKLNEIDNLKKDIINDEDLLRNKSSTNDIHFSKSPAALKNNNNKTLPKDNSIFETTNAKIDNKKLKDVSHLLLDTRSGSNNIPSYPVLSSVRRGSFCNSYNGSNEALNDSSHNSITHQPVCLSGDSSNKYQSREDNKKREHHHKKDMEVVTTTNVTANSAVKDSSSAFHPACSSSKLNDYSNINYDTDEDIRFADYSSSHNVIHNTRNGSRNIINNSNNNKRSNIATSSSARLPSILANLLYRASSYSGSFASSPSTTTSSFIKGQKQPLTPTTNNMMSSCTITSNTTTVHPHFTQLITSVDSNSTPLTLPHPLPPRSTLANQMYFPPLLGEQRNDQKGWPTLVLDLDETLVHSSFVEMPGYAFAIPVEIEGIVHTIYVGKRPGVEAFLRSVALYYEVIIFTASLAKYADPLMDRLDPKKLCVGRLFRESCVFWNGQYIKDLSRLGRDIRKVVIIDNSASSYAFQPDNAIPIESWFGNDQDTELLELIPVLTALAKVENIPDVMRRTTGRSAVY